MEVNMKPEYCRDCNVECRYWDECWQPIRDTERSGWIPIVLALIALGFIAYCVITAIGD